MPLTNIVQMNSWDRYLTRSSIESLSMIQAALLGQTFAILSGVPARLNLAQAYHGTLIAWARQSKMFKERPESMAEASLDMSPTQVNKAWSTWAQSQQRIRLVLGLQIHDAELAMIFHHEPLLRHEKEGLRRSTTEQLFNATTSSSWWTMAQKMRNSSKNSTFVPHNLSTFDGYAMLDGLAAAICESRQQDLIDSTKQSFFVSELLRWQHVAKDIWKDHTSDPLCLAILWHSTFISLLANPEKMECAIGKDGLGGVSQVKTYIIDWASSPAASRCLMHAFCLQRKVELIRYGHESALHVPRCLFQASYIWYLYGIYAPHDSVLPQEEYPEFQQIGITLPQTLRQQASTRFENSATPDLSALYTLKDLLQRVGRWGLGKKYASVLGLLIEGDVNSAY